MLRSSNILLIESFNPNDKDLQCSKSYKDNNKFQKKTKLSQYTNLLVFAIFFLITLLTIHFYILIKEKSIIKSSTNDLLAKVLNFNETIDTLSVELLHNKRIKNNLSNQMYQYKEESESQKLIINEINDQLTKAILDIKDYSLRLEKLESEQFSLKESLKYLSDST